MEHPDFSFPKNDRLCSHNDIEELFTTGKSFICYPYRVVFMEKKLEDEQEAKVLISVSKRKFKRAVHRNLLKRRIKEAYRLNRSDFKRFLFENNKQIIFGLVYISSDKLPYSGIEKGMKKTLSKLLRELNEAETPE